MQRLSNTALSLALTLFIMSVSLALIAAAWLITTFLVDGPAPSLLLK